MKSHTNTEMNSESKSNPIKVLLLTSVGAGLEYYDFAVFAFFAAIIGKLYFNIGIPALSVIAGYAVFAIGTVARLFGGLVFSYFGDKYGRKSSFLYTIFFMTLPSLGVSILPGYATLGIIAPILLLTLRFLQGAAVGGELPTAISFIAEFYSDNKRSLACSFLIGGVFAGFLLASCVQLILSHFLTAEQIQNWGWRLAYLVGGLFGIIGFIIRRKLQESPVFLIMQRENTLEKNPIKNVLTRYHPQIFFALLFNAALITFVFIFFTYLPNYLVSTFNYKVALTAKANTLGILISIVSVIAFGFMSRLIDKKIIYYSGCLLFFIASYPIFLILSQPNEVHLFVCFVAIGIFSGTLLAPAYAILAEQFPAKIRISGIGISLNLSTIFFGALGAEICAVLVGLLHDRLAPAYYVMGCCVISAIGLLMLMRTAHKPEKGRLNIIEKSI